MDPAIVQALEETQEALREEQRALGELPDENVRLRERLGQLQTERDSLHHQLELLRKGQLEGAPRLPDALPFEVRPLEEKGRYFYWRRALAVMLTLLLLVELTPRLGDVLSIALLPVLLSLLLVLMAKRAWDGPASWLFTEDLVDARGGGQRLRLPYSNVLEAEAHVSASQRHRGVGTVLILCKPTQEHPAGNTLVLRNVPEPERLAEFLRWKRAQTQS